LVKKKYESNYTFDNTRTNNYIRPEMLKKKLLNSLRNNYRAIMSYERKTCVL